MPETKGWDRLDKILSKPIKQEFKVIDFHMTDLPKYAKEPMERHLNKTNCIMYLSTKFINKFKDENATFSMADPIYGGQSTYSAQGLDIDEYLEAYTSLVRLEGKREKLVWNEKYIPKDEFISQLGNINTQIDEIAKLWKL